MKYRSFEKPLEDLEKQMQNLTSWQCVEISRHPARPYTLDYINFLCGDTFFPIFGDRNIGDDKSIVGGFGKMGDQSFMLIGHQKGRTTSERAMRNFGMAHPEGYRKALRLMRMAEKFSIPVITFVDTPGAYPGIEAEKRGQAEAIAKNIYEILQLKVPIMNIIIGEGASGGALGIGVGDRILMMQYSWYSVISPESCSTILWKSVAQKQKAAESLKLTSKDMVKLGLIDGIIPEPIGGAHKNPQQAFENVKNAILKEFENLKGKTSEILINERLEKYAQMKP